MPRLAELPLHDTLEDNGNPPGHSINDLRLTGDGIHHNNGGQRLVCELLTRRIAAGMCRQ
jgi:lysophospholipase L1-like esterase